MADKMTELVDIIKKLKLLSGEVANNYFSNDLSEKDEAEYIKFTYYSNVIKFNIICDYIRFAQDKICELEAIAQSMHENKTKEV